jgi:DNA-binding CsgD family transcriptional regulator
MSALCFLPGSAEKVHPAARFGGTVRAPLASSLLHLGSVLAARWAESRSPSCSQPSVTPGTLADEDFATRGATSNKIHLRLRGHEACSGGVHVKVIRRSEAIPQIAAGPGRLYQREYYYFYERNTGVAHFHVEAGPDGQLPVDQAAGLLAMHCMIRGQAPADYVVLVQAESDHLAELNEKAAKLLQAGQSVSGRVKLTRREDEVLGGVVRSLSNKEIGATLNLSERTVKFHVSSLLAKFRVRGRMELVQEASRQTATPLPLSLPNASREARSYSPVGQAAQNMSALPPRKPTIMPLAPKRQFVG